MGGHMILRHRNAFGMPRGRRGTAAVAAAIALALPLTVGTIATAQADVVIAPTGINVVASTTNAGLGGAVEVLGVNHRLFTDGSATGFTGNAGFVSAMKSRGFDFDQTSNPGDDRDSEDRLFAATALNITTALADDLNSAGFGKLETEDLFKAAIFKINSQFMREMKASGFQNLGMEELVKARIFKIDAEFVRQVSQMGFDKEPFESLVKMQIFKVTPEFVTEMRNEGLTNIQIEDLVKLRIFKIDTDFIRAAKADGVPLEVERLVRRKIGVARN